MKKISCGIITIYSYIKTKSSLAPHVLLHNFLHTYTEAAKQLAQKTEVQLTDNAFHILMGSTKVFHHFFLTDVVLYVLRTCCLFPENRQHTISSFASDKFSFEG